jgi:hypothetical protein
MSPQRYPYNPGNIGFGPNYGYQQILNDADFAVWTLAFDVSGIQSAVLNIAWMQMESILCLLISMKLISVVVKWEVGFH